MFLLRVTLPDRPGALGHVASALGTVGADIAAVEIVQRSDGYAVDDFMLHLPAGEPPDSLVSVCTGLDDVDVLWVSHYPESWNLHADVDLLNAMTENPEEAETIMVRNAPDVFHVHWAVLLDRDTCRVEAQTPLAPELTPEAVERLGDLGRPRTFELGAGWLEGWNDTVVAVAPFRDQCRHSIVVGRNGGPSFLPSELARLRHLAALADAHPIS